MSEFSFSELYDATLKVTSKIEIDGKTVEPKETIAAFDKILIADFQEKTKVVTAHGGYMDRDRVWWEYPKEIDLVFTQGIFSSTQLAVMTNSNLIKIEKEQPLYYGKRVVIDVDDEGNIELPEEPFDYFFVYNTETGEKVNYEVIDGTHIRSTTFVKQVLVDYAAEYNGGASILRVGSPLTKGYLAFQGKTRVKDDITGLVRTGILFIPKLKLMSDISIRVGKNAKPNIGVLNAVACPFGSKGNERLMEMRFLNDDIDSDI